VTAPRDTDRLIATWLVETSPEGHVDYLDETLEAIGGLRQRPAWASLGRWLPTRLTLPRVAVPRAAPYLALLALLLIGALLALVIAGSQKRLPPPFGLAVPGLVAFTSGDDIIATMPDGTGRRPLVANDGVQWGLIWSHRGNRFAYWSASSANAELAHLWVADGDGSNQHRLTGDPVPGVADLLPNVTWSPDDRQLAFSNNGVLYVADADGTGLHRVGDPDHDRGFPVWSPDGSLIAYTGSPLHDPYTTWSVWVISPDGAGDHQVIPAAGGAEIANVNPSWSPDSRSLLSHTGDGTEPTSIWIAHRDAAGAWSQARRLISGPEGNYLPAWSTTGTRFTFLRAVEAAEDVVTEDFFVMVADADGSHVRRLSDRHVSLATPCWSPDDRFIRAEGAGADRTILLIPLDGSPPLDIPAGSGGSAGCYLQRLPP
jgi:Tol biopolymer transport system component